MRSFSPHASVAGVRRTVIVRPVVSPLPIVAGILVLLAFVQRGVRAQETPPGVVPPPRTPPPVAVAPPATIQETPSHETPAEIVIAAGDVPVRDVLKLYSDLTGLPVLIGATRIPQLAAEIAIVSDIRNPSRDLVQNLLAINGWRLTEETLDSGEHVLTVEDQTEPIEPIVEVLRLRHATPDVIASVLQQFLRSTRQALSSAPARVVRTTRRLPGAAPRRLPAAGRPQAPEPTLIPDNRTNRIIVVAYSQDDMESIHRLFREIDVAPEPEESPVHSLVYHPEHQAAPKLAAALEALLMPEIDPRRPPQTSRQPGAPRIVAYAPTNTLVILCDAEAEATVRSLLAALDTPSAASGERGEGDGDRRTREEPDEGDDAEPEDGA